MQQQAHTTGMHLYEKYINSIGKLYGVHVCLAQLISTDLKK